MRELTIEEHDVVSGGQNYIDLNPGSNLQTVTASFYSGNFFNNISLGFGSPAGLEGLSASLDGIMASLIAQGIIQDPNLIVVSADRQTPNNPDYVREALTVIGNFVGGMRGGVVGFGAGVLYDKVPEAANAVNAAGGPYAFTHGGISFVNGVKNSLP